MTDSTAPKPTRPGEAPDDPGRAAPGAAPPPARPRAEPMVVTPAEDAPSPPGGTGAPRDPEAPIPEPG
ncbi:hypothetical protein [Roseicella frigidaeris]|uniref:Uncharacterized protein n=1 Tax=Roseicella frigidaeris TaxID=2230885 RepID=A0A327M722_9PROT|nr:hypothetical protein [Roseicella frigidaeris]RAI58092.1 hypothetical protein DOO78_15275 [Roseicella frigidaeris]